MKESKLRSLKYMKIWDKVIQEFQEESLKEYRVEILEEIQERIHEGISRKILLENSGKIR